MKDWSEYIDQKATEVLAKLSVLGYKVQSDELGIFSYRNILLQKGNESAELVCVPNDLDEYEAGRILPEEAEWWVTDIFEDGESFNEYYDSHFVGKENNL